MSRLAGLAKRSPLFVASLQAGSLMCVGDVISQKLIERREQLELVRTARFGCMGLFMVGPVLRTWYGFLESRVHLSTPMLTAVGKMAADQLLLAPVFLANFIGINSLLQGNSFEQAKRDVSSTYFDILISNYQLWPGVQMVNFWLVPFQYRILFVQSVAVAWNTYLSWKTNKKL